MVPELSSSEDELLMVFRIQPHVLTGVLFVLDPIIIVFANSDAVILTLETSVNGLHGLKMHLDRLSGL